MVGSSMMLVVPIRVHIQRTQRLGKLSMIIHLKWIEKWHRPAFCIVWMMIHFFCRLVRMDTKPLSMVASPWKIYMLHFKTEISYRVILFMQTTLNASRSCWISMLVSTVKITWFIVGILLDCDNDHFKVNLFISFRNKKEWNKYRVLVLIFIEINT